MNRPLLGLLLAAAGCGVPEATMISVTDDSAALSSAPGDRLFTVTLSESARPFEMNEVDVIAALPGKTAWIVELTHVDANENGLLDAGDSLICTEPIANVFDGRAIGQNAEVQLVERRSQALVSLAIATWVPAN